MTLLFLTNNVFGEEHGSDEEKGKILIVHVLSRREVSKVIWRNLAVHTIPRYLRSSAIQFNLI